MKTALRTSPLALQGIVSKASLVNTGRFLAVLALFMTITISLAANHQRLPAGTYVTTVSAEDIPNTIPAEGAAVMAGEWQIEFTTGGSFITSRGGGIVVVGQYSSDASHLIVTDMAGYAGCGDSPRQATGTYTWMMDNEHLTLTPVRDRCIQRAAILAAHPLQTITAANAESLPAGTYATTITLDDVPASFPFPAEGLAGQWHVEFTDAGSVIVNKDGEIAVVGHYTSSSGQLEMTDVLGDYACALVDEPGTATGSYSWTLADGELTLAAEIDLCEGRPVVLAAHPLVAMANNSSSPLLTSWPSDEDPGGPFYARIDGLPLYHDADYAAIVFYREPASIPESFNLVTFFDPPAGPDSLGAFGVPLTVTGTHLWAEQAGSGSPSIATSQGLGAVPVWFVPTAPLLALIEANNQVLTITDLMGIEGVRVGSATYFQEALHPHPLPAEAGGGGHPRPYLSITARGTLEDGGRFTLNISGHERLAGWQRTTSIRFQ